MRLLSSKVPFLPLPVSGNIPTPRDHKIEFVVKYHFEGGGVPGSRCLGCHSKHCMDQQHRNPGFSPQKSGWGPLARPSKSEASLSMGLPKDDEGHIRLVQNLPMLDLFFSFQAFLREALSLSLSHVAEVEIR